MRNRNYFLLFFLSVLLAAEDTEVTLIPVFPDRPDVMGRRTLTLDSQQKATFSIGETEWILYGRGNGYSLAPAKEDIDPGTLRFRAWNNIDKVPWPLGKKSGTYPLRFVSQAGSNIVAIEGFGILQGKFKDWGLQFVDADADGTALTPGKDEIFAIAPENLKNPGQRNLLQQPFRGIVSIGPQLYLIRPQKISPLAIWVEELPDKPAPISLAINTEYSIASMHATFEHEGGRMALRLNPFLQFSGLVGKWSLKDGSMTLRAKTQTATLSNVQVLPEELQRQFLTLSLLSSDQPTFTVSPAGGRIPLGPPFSLAVKSVAVAGMLDVITHSLVGAGSEYWYPSGSTFRAIFYHGDRVLGQASKFPANIPKDADAVVFACEHAALPDGKVAQRQTLEILANPSAKTLYRLLIQRSEDEAWGPRLMDATLKRYPDDLDILKFASAILIHRSKPDHTRAVQIARHAVELTQGKNGFLQASLAEALKAQGDRTGAIAAAKEAIRLEPIPDHHALLSRCEAMKIGKEDSTKNPK